MTYDIEDIRRTEFPWTQTGEAIYLNNASTGPQPTRCVQALAEFNELRRLPSRISQERQFGTLARGRELCARLIGATPAEIALAVNTSYGLNLAAFSLPLRAGDVVVTPDLEFPANIYPWMQLAQQRGVVHRIVPCRDGVVDEEALMAQLDDPAVKAVSVSWVGFQHGYTIDLAALGRACRARGVYLVVDAIQGLGPRTIDVRACAIDILSCGCQKWLLSPWGTGFVYVRDELVRQLEPNVVSWLAVRDSDDFSKLVDYDLTWRDDARRFEFITLPFHDYAGMSASLELLLEVGPQAAEAHVRTLADRIVEWARSRDDVTLVTPADPAHRAGIVAVKPPAAARVSERLTAAGVAHSLREGAIRLSPNWFNTRDEVDRALELIERVA